jgi:hypothetical protein
MLFLYLSTERQNRRTSRPAPERVFRGYSFISGEFTYSLNKKFAANRTFTELLKAKRHLYNLTSRNLEPE